MPTPDELKDSIKNFAVAVANVIGTEETYEMLNRLTTFATTCPDTIVELRNLVVENPKMINGLLTREGVEEAKGMIETISAAAPMFDFMKF